ncbi:MAG: GTP-binding protein, partial [Parvibaculum sp.]
PHGAGGAQGHEAHEHPFWSGSVQLNGVCTRALLTEVLRALPSSILRLKGVVATDEGMLTVQYVAGRLRISPYAGDEVASSLVFVGVGDPQPTRIAAQLRMAQVS